MSVPNVPASPIRWKRLGAILSSEREAITSFPASVERLPNGEWRVWYSTIQNFLEAAETDLYTIGYAQGPLDKLVRRDVTRMPGRAAGAKTFTLGNLPAGWEPVQPVHIALPDGRFRLYFWAHGRKDHVVRFLAAESGDGVNYNVLDPSRPCLYHYNDRACPADGPAGLTYNIGGTFVRPEGEPEAPAGLCCNDATTVYRLDDGTWECYSAAIRRVPKDSPAFVPHDNAAGFQRYITRFSSDDGLAWRADGPVVEIDGKDAPELQFYYLAVTHTPEGRVGFLGHYDVWAQTMDIERCFSKDGLRWERNERGPFILREPGEMSVYNAANMGFDGERWILFYTSYNTIHSGQYCSGRRKTAVVKAATLDGTET